MGCELIGMQELINKFASMGKAGEEAMDEALQAGAEPLLAEMKSNASGGEINIQTGALLNSLEISPITTNKYGKVVWIGDVNNLCDKYPWYVEYGHGGPRPAPAHPFMRNAWKAQSDNAKSAMIQALSDKLQL